MTKRASRAACAALIAAALAFAAHGKGVALNEQEEAGRAIYEEGRSAFADPFGGRIGMGLQAVPGEAVRCANCHGADGLGRPEGGVRPPSITWSELTRANGHAHDNGRRHPGFDEVSVARAIVMGRDPAGNTLDGTMPRFDISDRDLVALVAYLKKLEQRHDPGIDADALRIGTLLPSAGRFAPAAQAVKGTLQAYFDRINRQGGIHGRHLELVAGEYAGRAEAASALRDLVAQGDVFALLAPFAADVEGELVTVASASHIPVVGPLTLFGDDPRVVNPYVFHLLAGVGELAEVLALHAAGDPGRAAQPAVLLHPDDALGNAVAEAVQEQLAAQGWKRVSRVAFEPGAFDAAAIARTLQSRGAQSVFVLGPGGDVRALADAALQSGHVPLLLVPGPLAPAGVLDFPEALDRHVLLAYPTIPTDQKPDALREYAGLFQGRDLQRGYQTLQVPAYCSAVLLVEMLKQAGRDLTRAKVVAALESLHGFDAGLVPALSYNSRRRIGALGGYVVAPDLKARSFRPLGGFTMLP